MEQHLYSIYNTTDDLTTLDHPIPDIDLTTAILIFLPLLYNLLINLLNYMKGSKLDVNHVITCIFEHNQWLKSKNRESAFCLKKGKGKY